MSGRELCHCATRDQSGPKGINRPSSNIYKIKYTSMNKHDIFVISAWFIPLKNYTLSSHLTVLCLVFGGVTNCSQHAQVGCDPVFDVNALIIRMVYYLTKRHRPIVVDRMYWDVKLMILELDLSYLTLFRPTLCMWRISWNISFLPLSF